MTPKIVSFNAEVHKTQFVEMNLEFVTWSHEQILKHHKVDMSSGSEGDSQEYVKSTINALLSLEPPKGFINIVEEGSAIVGMAVIKTIELGIGEVKRMFIRPDYRGKGYGKELMGTLVTKARELGYITLRLETADFMSAALKIYQSAGFIERGPYPGGEVPEWYQPYCIFMEKDLLSGN
jgi:GNAT superfamily N-acetyltransferase